MYSASQKPLTSFKKVLFLGNSITYDGTFIVDIETYLRLQYPDVKVEIINVGLPSETVSGLSEPGHADNRFPRPDLRERLSRVLEMVKPDLVFAGYGINDGIYLPIDKERFARFQRGIRWLHDEVSNAGAVIIHITPPFFDELRGGEKGYENVMTTYAGWLVAMKDSGWAVIDIYNPMKEYLMAHREVDNQFHLDGFELAEDGVHPNANAHWLMARSILVAMGENASAAVPSMKSFVAGFENGKQVWGKINEKQSIMKDAWLTAIGHKRPEMKKGLPLKEAKEKENVLEREIDSLRAVR